MRHNTVTWYMHHYNTIQQDIKQHCKIQNNDTISQNNLKRHKTIQCIITRHKTTI